MVRLQLLGGVSLNSDQGPVCGPAAQRRRLALLALLAASNPRTLSREKLTACLWPERDNEHARNLLNQAVYAIRKALGEAALVVTRDGLRWNAEAMTSDVVDFEQRVAAGELERAVELYGGPFLDGFFLSDAAEFEQWVAAERERYGRLLTRALSGLAEKSAALGDPAAASEWWRRLAEHEPYDARVTLRMMEAMAAAGDKTGALRQARLHAELVEREFGAGPDPAVAALAERLRSEPRTFAVDTTRAQPPGPVPEDGAAPDTPTARAVPAPGSEAPLRGAHVLPSAMAPRRRRARRWQRLALPVAAAAVIAAPFLARTRNQTSPAVTDGNAAPAPARGNIAVLACTNGSRDPEQEYFSDGLAEELIGVLSRVRALRVVARSSAFAFKGRDQDVREIGRALNVGTILECSVQRENGRVRVTANLIDATDGFSLWSDVYEHEGADLFAIRRDLALRIASALHAELTVSDRARLARPPTANPEAHVFLLRGRHFWNQRTSGGLLHAIEQFERAIELDPNYAAAYAGLATAYGPLGLYTYHLTPQQSRELMREAAVRAVELDDGLAESHAALAAYLTLYAWDWEAAEKEFVRAIELDPGYATARMWYSYLLDGLGRFEESVRQATLVIQLDPLSPLAHAHLGRSLNLAGRSDLGQRHLNDAIELDSTFWIAHMYLGEVYESTGRLDEALRAHESAVRYGGTNLIPRAHLARILMLAGRAGEARALIGALQKEADETGVYSPAVATALWARGDRDAALAWLSRAAGQHHPAFPHLLTEPGFAALLGDPRVLELLRRAGLS